MSELIRVTPDPVVAAIQAWIGDRPVPDDVMERDQILAAIEREIGISKLPRHLEILSMVRNARASIGDEVQAREEAAEMAVL